MTNLTRKMFSLQELRYGLILVFSIGLCIVTYYIDEQYDPGDQWWLSVSYYVSFSAAVLWSGANYAGHIRMNSLYLKQNDIRAYVDRLAMSAEDKTELRNYLEDYAADLERKGRSGQEAAKEAIDQFRVREILSMSKHSKPFESHDHHYLLGYALIVLSAAALCAAFGGAASALSPYLHVVSTVFAVYGASLILLFAFYKILDGYIYEKLKNYFT